MPRVLHAKAPRKGGIRVFLATPAYSGLSAAYTYALFASQQELIENGINANFEIMAENCHVDDSRNVLVRDFLETDCDMLVFLDADLRWSPSDLVKLIKHEADIVAGIYPLKEKDESYPVRLFQGEIWANSQGLVEVEAVPTGFLKISRKVLQKLADKAPGFYGKADTSERMKVPLIFERTMENSTRWGGDYTFCRKAAQEGFKIWIDPEMTFEHSGDWQFNGCYGDYLRKVNNIPDPKLIDLLIQVKENPTDETFVELFKRWGNDWAASPELLMTSYELAKQHNHVFECGSGLSTLVMGTVSKVTAYESDFVWYNKVKTIADHLNLDVNIVYSPIKDYGEFYWYSDTPPEFDMVLVDGPVRSIGRDGFYRLANYEKATVLADDYTIVDALKDRDNFQYNGSRPFLISRPLCLKKSA